MEEEYTFEHCTVPSQNKNSIVRRLYTRMISPRMNQQEIVQEDEELLPPPQYLHDYCINPLTTSVAVW